MESQEENSKPKMDSFKEEKPSWSKLKTRKLMKTGVVILAVLLFLAIFTSKLDFLKPTGWATSDYGTADVEFYVMSQCPYGTQVEDAIKPVLDELGNSVNLKINFIAQDNGDGTFASLHGQPEVDENIRQLCAMKLSPKSYMDFIVCQNKDIRNADSNWESCAEEANIDVEALRTCSKGNEGIQLHSASVAKANAVQAMGSPTIFMDGQSYVGGRDPISFKIAICSLLNNHPKCSEMPECISNAECNAEPGKIGQCIENECQYTEDAAFEVIVINDEKCGAQCNPAQILATTQQLFLGSTFKMLDVSDAEAQELINKLGLQFVPAYLFNQDVTKTFMWQNRPELQGSFEKRQEFWKLRDEASGASYWINPEARAAFFESLGIKVGDNKPQMDFFVMSYCHYGNQAEEGIAPVYELLKNKADFNPRYVWYSNYQGGGPQYCLDDASVYCSMHGIQEANQNVRELCVAQEYGMDEWFDFAIAMNAQCNYQNADSCWQAVAESLSLDVNKINACEKNDWLELVKADKELGDKLGVAGSPQVFVDGQEFAGGRTPSAYQAGICNAFETAPVECANALSDSGVQAAPAGGCGA